VLDLDEYRDLVYVVRGDGRSYMANVRTDTIGGSGGGDVWQAPFATRARASGWAEVRIPFSAFMMTRRGRVVAQRAALPRDSIVSVGVSVSAHAGGDDGGGGGGDGGGGEGGGVDEGSSSDGGLPYLGGGAANAAANDGGSDSNSRTSSSRGGGGADTFRLLVREIRAEGRAVT
jgi:hypothetical protein